MANETTTSTLIMLAAALSESIAPMFTSAAIMSPLIAPFSLNMPNAKAMDLPVSGTVTASVVAEASASTPQTLTDTKVTLTLKKAVVTIKPTVETLKFATAGQPGRLISLAQQACVKKYEQDAIALASGFSQSVDSGTALTVAKTLEAAFLVKAGNIPSGTLDAVLSYGASMDVASDIRTQTGAFYGNPNFNPANAAGSGRQQLGFMGSFFGINWWETGNYSTGSGNDEMMVINRDFALAGLYPVGNVPEFEAAISEHQEFTSGNVIIRVFCWYQVAEYIDAAGVRLLADS